MIHLIPTVDKYTEDLTYCDLPTEKLSVEHLTNILIETDCPECYTAYEEQETEFSMSC